MENRNDGRYSVNPLEAKTQINQHARERINHRPFGLALQLLTDLRSHDFYLIDTEVRKKESVRQSRRYGRIDDALEFIEGTQDPAPGLVTIINDGLGHRCIALAGVGPGPQGIFFQQVIG